MRWPARSRCAGVRTSRAAAADWWHPSHILRRVSPLISVIILVYNRREALARTLEEVYAALERLRRARAISHANDDGVEERPAGQTGSGPAHTRPPSSIATAALADDGPGWLGMAEIIVVDNASTDAPAEMVGERFPHCRVITLDTNLGVAAFNEGAALAYGSYLLILDDDAWPDGDSLTHALDYLDTMHTVAAVMLQPVHPRTGVLEWPFDRKWQITRNWPDLRCANLIRREAWEGVGGYEGRFFLYRNDTDLALKLLGSGHDVAHNPGWRAMHDSPHIAVRRVRWFTLSTRNWCWMCRRHARFPRWVWPAVMGWLWAHRLAGLSASRHWATVRGGFAGLFAPAPRVPACVKRDGAALRRLISLKRSLRR